MTIIIFLIGLSVGSFLNALVYRLHEKKSLFSRSICPKCQAKIYWFDNIPILSFVFLRGRCRHCQTRISWQYPTVELVTALLFVLITIQHPTSNIQDLISNIRDWLIIFTGLFIFLYDLKYMEVEDKIVLPMAILILILSLLSGTSFTKLILAVIISVGFFALQYFLTRGKGIGLGDLRIGFFMAVSLSWPKILLGLFFAYIIGALISGALLILKKKDFKDQLPLGPFLVFGTLLTLFFGDQIIQWYLNSTR